MSTATQTFREFLADLAREQGGPEVRARRDEWLGAVERLFTQIEGWLKKSDPDGVLEVHRRDTEREEAGLGRYAVPELVISVGKLKVEVTPGGRNSRFVPSPLAFCLPELDTAAAASRRLAGGVDIGNRYRRWNLYRVLDAAGNEEWWAVKRGAAARDDDVRKWNQPVFEFILQDVLS